jgi:1-deoxy-D-xylulose-5-phosphate synthase
MFEFALRHNGPVAIRYPRGKISQKPEFNLHLLGGQKPEIQIGKAEILIQGDDIAIIAIGNTVYPALSAAERLDRDGISTMVVNARFIKPIDRNLLFSIASKIKRIVTIEENVLAGGFGSAVLEFLDNAEVQDVKVRRIGLPDEFIEQGNQAELRKKYGLDEEGIYQAALSLIGKSKIIDIGKAVS